MIRLLPEWHPQWGVMLAWPHPDTDWKPLLPRAEHTYSAIARAILAQENLLLLCRDAQHEAHIRQLLGNDLPGQRLHCRHVRYNDTWARDFGPLTVADNNATAATAQLRDFTFNGWGNKFVASDDNRVTQQLDWTVPVQSVPLVLEGGSVEINSRGQLLTTRQCLLNPNRNPQLDQAAIEAALREHLGATDIWWLSHGDLEGDDTDAHIDTLARFCDDSTIAYVQCDNSEDSHYPALQRMEKELQQLAQREQLSLLPLPLPAPQYDEEGQRLPATYANFLIINGAVLMPTYDCDSDEAAVAQLARAFPQHKIVPIPCLPLTWQHGSLHCVTMQLPEGVTV